MTMAGERLAFLREIFLRRIAKSDDKRKAYRRTFFCDYGRYIVRSLCINKDLRSQSIIAILVAWLNLLPEKGQSAFIYWTI